MVVTENEKSTSDRKTKNTKGYSRKYRQRIRDAHIKLALALGLHSDSTTCDVLDRAYEVVTYVQQLYSQQPYWGNTIPINEAFIPLSLTNSQPPQQHAQQHAQPPTQQLKRQLKKQPTQLPILPSTPMQHQPVQVSESTQTSTQLSKVKEDTNKSTDDFSTCSTVLPAIADNNTITDDTLEYDYTSSLLDLYYS